MEKEFTIPPRFLALFDKRIEGDDALLQLASLRFKEAGLGCEYYAETPDRLDWLLTFKPSPEAPAAVHLPRELDLFRPQSRQLVMDFAEMFNERLFALIVHDQPEACTRFADYVSVLVKMGSALGNIKGSPHLFIEYASGLEPEVFLDLFRTLRETERISACVDTGHVGLAQVNSTYSRLHPGQDIFSLANSYPALPHAIEDVQTAVSSALSVLLDVINELALLGKPLHFHLHDGHPLLSSSPFAISDHLSFLTEVPIPFQYKGKYSLPTMFGPSGLRKIVSHSLAILDPRLISFSLEIHPTEGRIPLGEASSLFRHWGNKQNAERMNFWLSVLAQNHLLLSEICTKGPVD